MNPEQMPEVSENISPKPEPEIFEGEIVSEHQGESIKPDTVKIEIPNSYQEQSRHEANDQAKIDAVRQELHATNNASTLHDLWGGKVIHQKILS